jgi:hypothetical protein
MQAAHGLHYQVHIIGKYILKILGYHRIGKSHILQANHFGHVEPGNLLAQVVNTSAHNAKTEKRNIHIYASEIFLSKSFVFLGKTLAIIWRIWYNDATTQINTKPIRERIAKNAFPNPFSGFVSQQQKIAFFKRSFGCTMIIFGKEVDL